MRPQPSLPSTGSPQHRLETTQLGLYFFEVFDTGIRDRSGPFERLLHVERRESLLDFLKLVGVADQVQQVE